MLNPTNPQRPAVSRIAAAGAAIMIASTLAACGESGGDTEDASGTVELTMAVVPSTISAPVFVGIDQGIFEDHGIDLTIDVGGLAPTIFPRLLEGDVDLGSNTWGTLVSARAEGLPLVGVAPIDRGGESLDDDYQAIMVGANGPSDAKGLEGKTIAVPTLKSFTYAQVHSTLEEQGADVSAINFRAIIFPDMPTALSAGRVDAAAVVEPFRTIVEGQGGKALAAFSRGQVNGAIVATERLVEERSEAVRRFQEAWSEVLEYCEEHPDAVRNALADGLDFEPAVAKNIALPIWTPEVTNAEVQEVSDMMAETGAVSDAMPAADLMADSPAADGP